MEPKFIKTDRIEVVDALRGFAVLAILLLHYVEHCIFSVYPSDSPAWLSVIDKGVFNGMFALFGGKAYAIFSLLFGFTFYIQYEHQRAKGKDFGFRFLWRLLGLAIIATINAAFFPGGDVLMLYAVVGIVLFIVRKWSDKAVLITAIILLLQPVEWFNYIMTIVNPEYQIPNYSVGALIYFPFGLYLAPYLGYTLSLLFGVLVFVVQLKFCKWWLSKHKYGPFEALWRRWTWNIF